MIIGYARVSTVGQNLDRQIDQLNLKGCDKIYTEKKSSMKVREEFEKMLEHIRPGDMIVVSDLTRIGRSTKELIEIFEHIHSKGADVKSLKEEWIDTTTPQGKFMFTIFAGISQFERDIISQRTKEGLVAARARGRIGGRKPKPKDKIDLALKMYADRRFSVSEITAATGISKSTLYKYINNCTK